MAVTPELRAAVRAAFRARCGYCGVAETFVGGELEVDHFHPTSAGGSDELDNLVYACTACNRFKGDYRSADAPEGLRLLHPRRDEASAHIPEMAQGRLIGMTPRGWFHIQRLHLNRPQLVELRRLHHVLSAEREDLVQARKAEARLQREISALEAEIARLRTTIADLLRRSGL